MVSLGMSELTNGSSYWDNGHLQSIEVNPDYGSGYLSEVRSFKSGISILVQNFSLYGDVNIRVSQEKKTPPLIAFFAGFSGIRQIFYTKPRVPLGGRFSNIESSEYITPLFMEMDSNTPVQSLIVCMEPAVFLNLTGKSGDQLVEALELLDWSAGRRNKPARLESMDFAQKMCAYQAFVSFMNNPCDTLFLEAKAFELVALQLEQLEHLTGKTPRKREVEYHVENICYACEILKKEMASPPNKLELARRVGLNHNQLFQGFKQMLGACPFEYLRTLRLEKARDLIGSRECNVTEAAFNVGYSSLSSFTKAFRKKFGINPKTFAKERKRIRSS